MANCAEVDGCRSLSRRVTIILTIPMACKKLSMKTHNTRELFSSSTLYGITSGCIYNGILLEISLEN